MEFQYNVTEEDYISFNLFHIKHSKTAKRSLNIQRWLSPVIFIAISYILSLMDDTPFLLSLPPFLIVSVLWVIFYPKYFYRRIKTGTRKFIREGKNVGMLGEHTLFLSEEGVSEVSANGENKVTWQGMESFHENDNYFYLYNSAVSAFIVPKRDLKNAEGLREYVTAHIQ